MTLSNDTKQYITDVAEWAAMHYGKDILEYLDDADFMASIMKEYNNKHRDFISKNWVNSEFMNAVATSAYIKINS